MSFADTLAAAVAWGTDGAARTNGVGRVVAEAHVHDDGSTPDGQPVTLVQAYNIQSVVRQSTGVYIVTPAVGIDASHCAHSVEYLGNGTGDDVGFDFSVNADVNGLTIFRFDPGHNTFENGAFTVAFFGNPISLPNGQGTAQFGLTVGTAAQGSDLAAEIARAEAAEATKATTTALAAENTRAEAAEALRPVVSLDVDLITTTNDVVTVYTLPATPTGSGRWVLSRALLRVKVVPTGTGTPSNTFRLGSTSGGQEVLLDVVVDDTAALGAIVAGEALLSLGSDMLAANGFEAVYAAGQVFYLKRTKGGTTVTGGTVTVTLHFEAIL